MGKLAYRFNRSFHLQSLQQRLLVASVGCRVARLVQNDVCALLRIVADQDWECWLVTKQYISVKYRQRASRMMSEVN